MASFMFHFVFYWFSFSFILLGKSMAAKKKLVCEPIRIQLCKDIGYNMTTMPNRMGHENQVEAESGIKEYIALIGVNCAPHMKHFVCSAFAPMCSEDVSYPVVACQAMCEEVRTGCLGIMKHFGFAWPEEFKCKTFPVQSKGTICMAPPGSGKNFTPKLNLSEILKKLSTPRTKIVSDDANSQLPPTVDTTAPSGNPNSPKLNLSEILQKLSTPRTKIVSDDANSELPPTVDTTAPSGNPNSVHEKYTTTKKLAYVKKKDLYASKCGEDIYFDKANKQFSDVWLLIWSTIFSSVLIIRK